MVRKAVLPFLEPEKPSGILTAENLHYKSGVWGMCLGSVGIRRHNFNPQCYCCFQHKRWWWSVPEPWTLKEAESDRLGPGTRKEKTHSGEFSAGAQISLRDRQMISPDIPMVPPWRCHLCPEWGGWVSPESRPWLRCPKNTATLDPNPGPDSPRSLLSSPPASEEDVLPVLPLFIPSGMTFYSRYLSIPGQPRLVNT